MSNIYGTCESLCFFIHGLGGDVELLIRRFDPQALTLTTRANGQVRQAATTADMIFSCRDIVAYLSRVMTLAPGTVITTGTPAGVGLFHPAGFLRAGDEVSVAISSIGELCNRVVAD